MTTAAFEDRLFGWATGGYHRTLQPRSVPQQVVRNRDLEIQESFRRSEFLNRPQRTLELARLELDKLWRIDKNWDSYGAEAPNRISIDSAWKFLTDISFDELTFTRILPSAEGGVAVAFVYENKRAIAEFYNDGTQDLLLYETSGATSQIEPTDDTSEAFRQAIRAFLFGERGQ